MNFKINVYTICNVCMSSILEEVICCPQVIWRVVRLVQLGRSDPTRQQNKCMAGHNKYSDAANWHIGISELDPTFTQLQATASYMWAHTPRCVVHAVHSEWFGDIVLQTLSSVTVFRAWIQSGQTIVSCLCVGRFSKDKTHLPLGTNFRICSHGFVLSIRWCVLHSNSQWQSYFWMEATAIKIVLFFPSYFDFLTFAFINKYIWM